MKLQSILRMALIAGVAILSSLSAYAQTTQAAPTPKPKMTHEERQQKRYDQVAHELNLTPEQRTKFEQTDRSYDEKMRDKRTASKEEMGKMREERMKAQRSVLTKEQAVKYDQMQAKRQEKHDAHQGKKGDKMHKKERTGDQKAPTDNKTHDNRERE